MRKIKKQHLIIFSLGLCIVAFVIPLLFSSCDTSFLAVLSISLACVGTIASVLTMIIALLLYDRFGLENKFVEHQTYKVLELVDLIKGRTFIFRAKGYDYFVRPSREQLIQYNKLKPYQNDRKKIVLMNPEDYGRAMTEILAIKRSYWLPDDIKNKMSFLEIGGFFNNEKQMDDSSYVRLDFGSASQEDWALTIPEITFENFNDNLSGLVRQIEYWLKTHSDITLDLKLEEPNQYITNQP
jgi:hypothetical protein